MKKKKNQRKNSMMLIYILLVAVIFMVAGYALLSQTITLTGTATADADFSVVWETPSITARQDDNLTAAPTLTVGGTVLNINAEFTKPGDYVEITVDVKNTGTVAAEITDIVRTNPTNTDMEFSVTPDFTVSQTLAPNASTQVVIRVDYVSTATVPGLIEETFSLEIEWTQTT